MPLITQDSTYAATYAAQHDFFYEAVCRFNGSECSANPAFPIPANQTLVIESVTGYCNNMLAGDSIQQVLLGETPPYENAILIPGGTASGTAALTFAQATKAYFPSGSNGQSGTLGVITTNGASEGPSAFCAAFINGYLVQ